MDSGFLSVENNTSLPEGFQLEESQQSSLPLEGSNDLPEGFQLSEDKYGSNAEMAKTALEGLASGVLSRPVVSAIETKGLGIKSEDIQGRREENPVVHGGTEALGLVGSLATGIGEGRLMTEAGQLAAHATDLGELGATASRIAKIGSSAVQQAAEMAVLESGNEADKMILQEPNTSAETALSHIGLAAALGGAGGTFMTGAVSPLWEATAGPQVNKLLNQVKNRVNGESGLVIPKDREQALKTLDIDTDPLAKAALSDNMTARDYISTLKRGENAAIKDSLDKLQSDASHSVANSMDLSPEQVLRYDKADAGHALFDSFEKEYKDRYQPIADALEKRNKEADGITLSDDDKLAQYNKLIERGMEKLRPGSEYGKIYEKYAEEILPIDTIGHLDQLRTELYNKAKNIALDTNEKIALNDIREALGDWQERLITSMASKSEKLGIEGAKQSGKDLLAERQAANRGYAQFSRMSNELSNHLGVGDFKGFNSLTNKLENKVTAEQLLNKFSVKNNADLIPFLENNFPETLKSVLAHERQQLIRPAVITASKKGENPIDINKLSDIIRDQLSQRSSYVDAVISKDTLNKIEAAKTLISAIPNPKNSGTPAGIAKIFKFLPTSAMAAIGWFTGHNPLVSAAIGHTASIAGQGLPEAYKLAYLRFISSTAPVEAQGFKAMVDFAHAVQKGETLLNKATSNVFKPGVPIITHSMAADSRDIEKLDKHIEDTNKNPGKLMQATNGKLGHYLPAHQMEVTKATAVAIQYLQGLKPHDQTLNTLDKPIKPTPYQIQRYNRALSIAVQPASVLQKVKDGTIQTTDIQDISHMYPQLYKRMIAKLSNQMLQTHDNEELIPYKTRMGLSLFLGQAMDSSMQPASIMAAQPKPKEQPQQPNMPMKNRKGTNSLGKSNKSYRTPGQASEEDRANRD